MIVALRSVVEWFYGTSKSYPHYSLCYVLCYG